MAATATRVAAPRSSHRIDLRFVPRIVSIVAMSIILGGVLAMAVVGAAAHSTAEPPAPGPIPMEPPALAPATPTIQQPETAPPGLDL